MAKKQVKIKAPQQTNHRSRNDPQYIAREKKEKRKIKNTS